MRLLLVCFFTDTIMHAPNLAGRARVLFESQECAGLLNKWKPLFSVCFYQPALKHQADKIAWSSLVCYGRVIPQGKLQTAATSSNLGFAIMSSGPLVFTSMNDFLTSSEVFGERLVFFTGKDLVAQQ